MNAKSGIAWTDSTWSPVTGCTKVSAGCKNCYAEREVEVRWSKNPKSVFYGRAFTDVRCHPETLEQPLHWKKPRKIFVCPRGDLFHPDVPTEFIVRVLTTIAHAKQHTFQVLTKRPARMEQIMRDYTQMNGRPLPNLWLGVSVEDQAAADERIPLLLRTPAAVRWISAEPLLGPVDLSLWLDIYQFEEGDSWHPRNLSLPLHSLDWLVIGGESGPNARPLHPDWAYSLRDQCDGAGVPLFFKQWGEWASPGRPAFGTVRGEIQHIKSDGSFWGDDLPGDENADVLTVVRVGTKNAGDLLGGREWHQYPEITLSVANA